MELIQKPEWNTPLNLGVPVEPLLVFPVFLDLVPTDQDKLLLVISAEKEECLLHWKFGEDGPEELTLNTKDTPLFLLSLLPELPHLFKLEDTQLAESHNAH